MVHHYKEPKFTNETIFRAKLSIIILASFIGCISLILALRFTYQSENQQTYSCYPKGTFASPFRLIVKSDGYYIEYDTVDYSKADLKGETKQVKCK